MKGKTDAGKGDKYRRVDPETWSRNWDAIFGKTKKPKRVRSSNKPKRTRRGDSTTHDV